MRKFNLFYLFFVFILLSACTSCIKKKIEPVEEVHSYEEFTDDGYEEVLPTSEKEYKVKLKVVRRVYLV